MADLSTIILYFTLFVSLFFEVFLLITFLEVREEIEFEEKHLGKNVTRFPSVSIIVPCFNEEKTIQGTVESLLALDYPKELVSLILVDDGSKDGTLRELKKFESNPQVTVLTKENGGKHTALNLALENVSTDLVGCLDADSFVNPDALKRIVPFFDKDDVMAVTPSIKVFEPGNVLQYVQRVEYGWGIFLRRMLSSMGALYVTPGPFSIFRTQVFKDLGGYKHAYHTEDMEMALRMQKNHYKIVNSHGAQVYTVTPAKFGALVKQRVRWTYGFLNNVFDYRSMFFNKKYGNIGIFILPIATFSVFSTLYAVGNAVWKVVLQVWDYVARIRVAGINLEWPSLGFDWFFLNTGVISILTVMTIILTVFTLLLSTRIAEGKVKFRKELIYYLVLYIFMVPVWLSKAVYKTFMRREISWR